MAVLIRRFPVQIGGLDFRVSKSGDAGEVTATDRHTHTDTDLHVYEQ